MDKLIGKYPCDRRNGLSYCRGNGVAYQTNMSKHVPYDAAYFKKYLGYEKTKRGEEITLARLKAVYPWALGIKTIDIGVGCGTFVKTSTAAGLDIYGYDINPVAKAWLQDNHRWANPYRSADDFFCWTFWDSLEHIPDPGKLLDKIPTGAFVFISMPIFDDLKEITESKHYRPNEHYYYFTNNGFLRWMQARNFKLMNIMNFEIKAGREKIKTYAFEKMAKIGFNERVRTLLENVFGF